MFHASWVMVLSQSSTQSLRWIFCPGHSGVRGNERVDALAGQATTASTLTLDPVTVLSFV